jgi:hypothetical protein
MGRANQKIRLLTRHRTLVCGTFRTYRARRKMSDLGSKTDVEQTGRDFGF